MHGGLVNGRIGLRASVALAAAIVLAGCGGRTSPLMTVDTRNACPGDVVLVSWAACGYVILSSTPPVPQAGVKDPSGSERVTVNETTRFSLEVYRPFALKPITEEHDVVVKPAQPLEFGDAGTCSPTDRAISLTMALGEQVSAGMKITAITNPGARDLLVTKDGVQVRLPPQGSSALLDGRPVRGTWSLRSPLGPNETCESLSHAGRLLTFKVGGCGD